MTGSRRTLVIGDVHGCLAEVDELLALVDYQAGRDRLVFLGDLLDRGPDPVGVLRRVRELGAECVLGNHEEKHLRYAAHEARRRDDPTYRNPMRRFEARRAAEHARLTRDDLLWLSRLPRVIALGQGWVAVHAGFLPGLRVAAQPPDWTIRLRYVDAAGAPVPRTRGDAGEPGVRRWAEAWTGPESVVYGHFPLRLDLPKRDDPAPGVACLGIDTGCVYGGRLTALVLPSQEVVQVRSRLQRTRPEDLEDDASPGSTP
ncbi:MAG TPA: metallophosphoesterase [Anaeromyxobacter sp.]|nr:metallophosphoesterase [Anaeromyxobacter sp.]